MKTLALMLLVGVTFFVGLNITLVHPDWMYSLLFMVAICGELTYGILSAVEERIGGSDAHMD